MHRAKRGDAETRSIESLHLPALPDMRKVAVNGIESP